MTGLLYLHPIISNRERGSEMRNLRMFKKICGQDNFKNVVLGLTFCDAEGPEVIASRQRQLENTPHWWGDMLSRGSRVERDGCIQLLSRFAPQGKLTLNIQAEVVKQGIALDDTEAASTIAHKQELDAIRARERIELANMQQTFERRIRKAKETFNRRLLLEQQDYGSIRRRQQIQEQSFRLKHQLQQELERKENLLRAETQAEEEARAQELARLEERIRQVKLGNGQIQDRRQIHMALVRAWPYIKVHAQRGCDDWAAVQDWKRANSVKQAYTQYQPSDGKTLDEAMYQFVTAFCDRCLKSYSCAEEVHGECMTVLEVRKRLTYRNS
jgi:hypothetical protein